MGGWCKHAIGTALKLGDTPDDELGTFDVEEVLAQRYVTLHDPENGDTGYNLLVIFDLFLQLYAQALGIPSQVARLATKLCFMGATRKHSGRWSAGQL